MSRKNQDLPKNDPDLRSDIVEDLKLCPFCGGIPTYQRRPIIVGAKDCSYYYFIECTVCRASSKRVLDWEANNIIDVLRGAWNGRV